PQAPPTQPPPYRPTSAPQLAGGGAQEWAVVSRLAEQRSVSFAGSVPVLVDGLPEDPDAATAVVRRLQAMSDLIQVVLLVGSSDPSLDAVDRSTAALAAF
ncbi:MAG: hypothetical protein M3Y51_08890, partial [Actinomycetota bacterium]|nr:hypothetical protein [Actinomycetota bacterium]